MPHYKKLPGEFGFMNCGGNGGLFIKFTHIPSGRSATFAGALTGFSDNYTSTWKEEPVYGRMDPIPTFQRTGRKINISWTILNESVETGQRNMLEVSKLINFLYPSYFSEKGGATTISTAPVLKMQFTNLANSTRGGGLVGYLAGFNFKPNIEAGWVKMSGDELIPTQIDADCEFTVLHTIDLGWHGPDPRTDKFPYGSALKPVNEPVGGTAGAGPGATETEGGPSEANPGEELTLKERVGLGVGVEETPLTMKNGAPCGGFWGPKCDDPAPDEAVNISLTKPASPAGGPGGGMPYTRD